MGHVTTLRLSDELAAEIDLIARVFGVTVSEVIRTAVAEYVTGCKNEVEFRERLAERIAEDQKILDALGGG